MNNSSYIIDSGRDDGWRKQLEEADATYDELFPSLSQGPNKVSDNYNDNNNSSAYGDQNVSVGLPAIDKSVFLPKYRENSDLLREEALRHSTTRW